MPDAASGPEPAPADEFDRELRELTEGLAGEPMFFEPSAAERAKSARVSRITRVARVTRVVPTVSAGPGGRSGGGGGTAGGRRGKVAVALFLTFLLLVAAALAWVGYMRSSPTAGDSQPTGSGPAAAVVQKYSGTISPIDFFAGPPADPFTGRPADHWADGAAGIVAPAAARVGGFTAAQVAAAYATTRKLLIAANLDMGTLLGGSPTAFARLLTAKQRAVFLAGLGKTGTDERGSPLSTRTLVASFAPGSTELVGSVIKAHGTMTARSVTRSGTVILSIGVNYLFAYAVEPPHDPTDWTRVVGHEYGSIDFAHLNGGTGALQPWDNATIETAGAQCWTGDGYIHPAYPSESSIDSSGSGPYINAYSIAVPPPGMSCGRATGT